jgi:hypothetical protein
MDSDDCVKLCKFTTENKLQNATKNYNRLFQLRQTNKQTNRKTNKTANKWSLLTISSDQKVLNCELELT